MEKKQYTLRRGRKTDLAPRQSIYDTLFDTFDDLKPGEFVVIEDEIDETEQRKIYQAFNRVQSRWEHKAQISRTVRDGKLMITKVEK